MENISKLSPLEVAVEILKEAGAPKNIDEILDAVIEAKGIDKEDNAARATLYSDIVSSSKFVFLGENDLWDLKLNHPLEEFDRDGASFIPKSEADEFLDDEDNFEEEEFDSEDSEDDDEDEDEAEDRDDAEEESEEYEEDSDNDYDDYDEDDTDDSSEDDFEEDKYNEIMDEFEDMYD